jgi:transposase-like protein
MHPMVCCRPKEQQMATKRNYRKFSAEQKLEIVIAGLKSGNVQEVCRTL